MKILEKIKLNELSKNELEKRKMNALLGGYGCQTCSCVCVGKDFPEGSTTGPSSANTANHEEPN